MNDETILDGGAPAVETAPVKDEANPEALVETPEQIEEKAKAEEERKRKTGSQRARAKAERLERENQALRDALARGTQKTTEAEPAKKATSPDGRPLAPKSTNFDSYDEYEAARDKYQEDLTDWKVENRLRMAELRKAEQAEVETVRAKAATAHEAHPDLGDLLSDLDDQGIAPTETMHRAIQESDLGAELLYHLAKNPAEVRRIGALPPVAQALELGAMLAQIKGATTATPKNLETKAPPPPKPIKGPATPSQDPSKVSDEDFWKGLKKRH